MTVARVKLLPPGSGEGAWLVREQQGALRLGSVGWARSAVMGPDTMGQAGGRGQANRLTWPLPLLLAPSFIISYFLPPSSLTRL